MFSDVWSEKDVLFKRLMKIIQIHQHYTMALSLCPCVQTGSRLPGTVWRGLIFFTTDRPHCILKCPHFPGTITAEWFWLCVRSQCHHIWRMRTFDENSCAISITSPRSLSPLRTQHVWWDHREKSRRASTLCDCQGKSHLVGLSPANGTQSERGM